MEIEIEKFAETEGKNIAEAVVSKYGEDLVVEHKSFFRSFFDEILGDGLSRLKVEKEIYDRSLHEATAFFLKNGSARNNDKINEFLRNRISIRLAEPKKFKSVTPEEMLANVIKIEALDFLLEKNVVI